MGALHVYCAAAVRPWCHRDGPADHMGLLHRQLRFLHRDQSCRDPHLGDPPALQGGMEEADHTNGRSHYRYRPGDRRSSSDPGPRQAGPHVEPSGIGKIAVPPPLGRDQHYRVFHREHGLSVHPDDPGHCTPEGPGGKTRLAVHFSGVGVDRNGTSETCAKSPCPSTRSSPTYSR